MRPGGTKRQRQSRRVCLAAGLALAWLAVVCASPALAQHSGIFTYYGDVLQADGVTPVTANYVVTIRNISRGDTVTATVGQIQNGKYQVTRIDFSGGNAAAAGDDIELILSDGQGAVLADAIVVTLTPAHIAAAGLRVDFTVYLPAVLVTAPAPQPTAPGQEIVFVFEVSNVGNVPDSYALTASNIHPDWLGPVPEIIGPVPPGGSELVSISLNVPEWFVWVTIEEIELEACSQFNPSVCHSDVTQVPVSVAVTASTVEYAREAVEIRWSVSEEAEGLPVTLYRRHLPAPEYHWIAETGFEHTGDEYRYRDRDVTRGETYEYLLEIDNGERLAFLLGRATVPAGVFALDQNYPNPFNPVTRVRFELDEPARVDLLIYDVSGRLVRTLITGQRYPATSHTVEWDGFDDSGRMASSGVYFLRMVADGRSLTRRMVLLK